MKNPLDQFLRLPVLLIACSLSLRAAAPPAGIPDPAKVRQPGDEASLANVELTEKAVERLGIRVVEVAEARLPRRRLLGGQIVFPTRADGAMASLQPPATPAALATLTQSRINAAAALRAAEVEQEAADIALRREEALLKAKTGTARAVDDARARVDRAKAALEAAQALQRFLGAPEAEVKLRARVWLRVPVYVGDLARLDSAAAASVRPLGGGTNEWSAPRVSGLPTASTNGVTVDWYYELDNTDGRFVPGQRLAAWLPLRETAARRVVPWSAVLHDIHGGAWVYEQLAPGKYRRRRVAVAFVQGGQAALARGPAAGTRIVSVGAMELFGTEFGVGK